MKYAQLVVGPAGSGKSTYCSAVVKYGQATHRNIRVINLDPAAEAFDYEPLADIRDLVSLGDVMEDEDLHFGPNGGLLFCMEYLIQHSEWLEEHLDGYDDEYILFDCPGQIELYTHMNIMQKLVEQLQRMDFRICAVFILDSHFASDLSKYFSGVLVALSTIVNMEVSSINIFSKVDLLNRQERRRLDQFLEPTSDLILAESTTRHGQKFQQLNLALAKLIDDYALVKFFPLDINDEENLGDIMLTIDNAIQWGEDADVKIPKDPEEQDEADEQEHN